MPDENRRFSRIPFKVEVELKIDDTSYHCKEISNLSVGGCLLPVSAELPAGAPCTISIMLQGAAKELSVRIDGEIVRSVAEGVAVNFTRIEPDSLFHLQNIIRYNSPDADAIEQEINRHPGIK